MNKVYLHYQKNNLLKLLFISLFLPVLYGSYKLAIYAKIFNIIIFKPFLFILIPFIISLFINYLKNKKMIINEDTFLWCSIGIFMPFNTNLILYTGILFVFIFMNTFFTKLKMNYAVLFKLTMMIVITIFFTYTYQNSFEILKNYSYTFLDLFFGRSVGGISSTSFLYAIISYIILSSSIYYKKEIPIISIIVYSFLSLILCFIKQDISLYTVNLSGILYALIFIAPLMKYSCYSKKGIVIDSIILGIFTFVFIIIINNYEGVFLALFIISIINGYIDKLFEK